MARRIILSTIGFALLTSVAWEILFGEGLDGTPRMALAATLGGTFWGSVIAGVVFLSKRPERPRGAVQQQDEADEVRER